MSDRKRFLPAIITLMIFVALFNQSCASKRTLTLTWENVPGATGYRVFYAPQGESEKQLEVKETKVKILGLTPGQRYCFREKSFNNAGESTFSQEICSYATK